MAIDKNAITDLTKKFEAEHEECIRALPYRNKDGQVEVHLYVYNGKYGETEAFRAAAQECFSEMGVNLEWWDLYNRASIVLNVKDIEYPSGKPERLEADQVDKISEVISRNLRVFHNHRNITAVQPSFKITGSQQTEESCITVFVLGKGRIPVGEIEIPRMVGGCPVDIIDGFWVHTVEPWKPTEAQKSFDVLPCGASIGVEGVEASGTLGAIVEDENNRGTLYLLSCHHVLNHSAERVVHPGLNDHLNNLKWSLQTYMLMVTEIPGPHRTEILKSLDGQETAAELSSKFREVEEIKEKHLELLQNDQLDTDTIDFPNVDERTRFQYYFPGDEETRKQRLSRLQENTVKNLCAIEEEFKRCLDNQPRHVATYTTGIARDLSYGGKRYFIDAAIAELTPGEVDKLINSFTTEIVGTLYVPSGKCIPATTKDMMNARKLAKSGRTTGYTTSKGLFGKPVDAPAFLQSKAVLVKGVSSDVEKSDYFCQGHVEKQQNESKMTERYPARWFSNCLCIGSEQDPFAKNGDSGAVIFERCEGSPSERDCLSGFGVQFGVFFCGNYICALASPLEVALKELSKDISPTCKLSVVSNYYL